jgi:hypothetical protein
VGSQAYAREQAALEAPIVGVFQMDMIGYRARADEGRRPFEVHVGYPQSAGVQARSLQLAQWLRGVLQQELSPGLLPPQIYTEPDAAAGRSDHASFQARGYAACVVSEDFFVGPAADSPASEPNPHYHSRTDTQVILPYAADVACTVGASALLLADA